MRESTTERALRLLRAHGPEVVDPRLATFELTNAEHRWNVLVLRWTTTEPYLVAHRPRWDRESGDLEPWCRVDTGRYSGSFEYVPPGVAAVFARACGRCSWPPYTPELAFEETTPLPELAR